MNDRSNQSNQSHKGDRFEREDASQDPVERAQQIQEILEVTLRQAVMVMQPPSRLTLDGSPPQKPGPETLMRCMIADDIVIIQALALLIETLVPEASVQNCRETLALKHAGTEGEA